MFDLDLKLELLSDTVLGRGDGVAGLVDIEVQHDEFGCPYLQGRTLRGLLVEECANILYALELQNMASQWIPAAHRLFGDPGSSQESMALLKIGDATLPADLQQAIRFQVHQGRITPQEIFHSLTEIDQQTAMNPVTGAPKTGSLRSLRVIIRKTILTSHLSFLNEPEPSDQGLLAACAMSLRRMGTNRNRGRGAVRVQLVDQTGNDLTSTYFTYFKNQVEANQ